MVCGESSARAKTIHVDFYSTTCRDLVVQNQSVVVADMGRLRPTSTESWLSWVCPSRAAIG